MNQTVRFVLLIFLVTVLAGCSGGRIDTVSPSPDAAGTDLSARIDREGSSQHNPLGAWILKFNLDELEIEAIPARSLTAHIDATRFVTPPYCPDCFKIRIIDVDPLNFTLNLLVTVKNPFPDTSGFDPRLILDSSLPGYNMLNPITGNPDGYTELWDQMGESRNPFVAFATEVPLREATGGSIHEFPVDLKYPGVFDPGYLVAIIDACTQTNCPEPYEIVSIDVPPGGISPTGSNLIGCVVHSWWGDIDGVEATLELPGVPFPLYNLLLTNTDGNKYEGVLQLGGTIEEGKYNLWFRTWSQGEPDIDLWQIIEVDVANQAPIACADVSDYNPNVGELVNFFDCSVDPDNDIVLYEWDLNGDGVFDDSFDKNPTWIYSTGGDYEIQLKVTDTDTNWDILDEPLLIEVNGPPVASAEADLTDVEVGTIVTITNTSVDDDGNGPITLVEWDVNGNGAYDDPEDIQNQDVIQLSWSDPGVYVIGLRVTDQNGLSDEFNPGIEINVTSFSISLTELQDLFENNYGTRIFDDFYGHYTLLGPINYHDNNGPWDFTEIAGLAGGPAIFEIMTPDDPGLPPEIASTFPSADFIQFSDMTSTEDVYYCYRLDLSGENGPLNYLGYYRPADPTPFDFGGTLTIQYPLKFPLYTESYSTGTYNGITYMTDVGCDVMGYGMGTVFYNSEPVTMPLMLVRYIWHYTDLDTFTQSFSMLQYVWYDSTGAEIVEMHAFNTPTEDNFFLYDFEGMMFARSLHNIL